MLEGKLNSILKTTWEPYLAKCLKIVGGPRQEGGIPDFILVTKESRAIFVEVKVEPNELMPRQRIWLENAADKGALVYCLTYIPKLDIYKLYRYYRGNKILDLGVLVTAHDVIRRLLEDG